MTRRPEAHESAPFYHHYISLVEGTDALQALKDNYTDAVQLYSNLAEEKWDYRYAEDKWTIKELLLHIIDAERVFAYRALRIARGDQTPLAGFDQDDYVPMSKAGERSAASLIAEYQAVRQATLHLFQNFTPEMLDRMGTASGKPVSALALTFMLAGHEKHHLNILKERYL